MDIKFDPGSLLIDVVSRWDSHVALAVGEQIRAQVLSVQDNLAVISIYGQEILVSTELLLQPGMVVILSYEGINEEGKHTFRLVEGKQAAAEPARLAAQVFRQFGIEPTPELLSRLEDYLRLGEAVRQPVLERHIEQFALLAKSGLPLNSPNLRIWHQFWRTPALEQALAQLLVLAEDDGGQPDQGLARLINSLFVQTGSADPQEIMAELLARLVKPGRPADLPADFAAGATRMEEPDELAADKGGASLRASLKSLEAVMVKLVEEYSTLKNVNAAGRRFCPQVQPLYLLIPFAHGGSAFVVELLVEDERRRKEKVSKKQQDIRLTLAIPTSRLGQVTAVITVQADQYALELIADSQEVVGLIKRSLDQSGLKEVFQSVSVRLRPPGLLQPKDQLLALIKQQIGPQIDLRV